MSITARGMTGGDTGALGRLPMLAPPLAALLYPFALEGFHTSVARIAEGASILSWLSAAASVAVRAPGRVVRCCWGLVVGACWCCWDLWGCVHWRLFFGAYLCLCIV